LIALMTILGSLLADVGYGLVNPQIRTGGRR
jgi:ABC-type dipeptide/oligopeptide/nickel transport system permease component